MCELKRIFFNKKIFIVFLGVLLFNGIVFYTENVAKYYDEEFYGDGYLKSYNREYEKIVEHYKNWDVKKSYEDAKEKLYAMMENDGAADDVVMAAYGNIVTQLEYLADFDEKYEKIKDNVENMYGISAFSAEGTFSRRNMEKTLKDFKFTENVNVTLDSENAVEKLINFDFSDYLLIVMIIVTVLEIYKERKRDLWKYIYSMKKGRRNLASARVAVIVIGSGIFSLSLMTENIILCRFFFGSFGSLDRAAQCNEVFNNLPLKINMLGVIILMTLFKILALSTVGIIFWMLISNIKTSFPAFGIFGGAVGAEYIFFKNIAANSVLGNLKFINVFALMNGKNMLSTYNNLNFFGYAFGKIGAVTVFFAFLFIMAGALTVFVGDRKPFSQGSGVFAGRVRIISEKIFQNTSILFHELWKTVATQKVWVICAAFFALCYVETRPETVFFDEETTVYNQYMEVLSGEVTDEKLDYLITETQLWQKKTEEAYEELKNCYNDGESYNENMIKGLENKIKKLEMAETVTQKIYEKGIRLKKYGEEGYNTGFVNNVSYDMYMGRRVNNKDSLYLLIFVVLTAAVTWAPDNQNNMKNTLRTTARGRGSLLAARLSISFFVISAAAAVSGIMRFLQYDKIYGLKVGDMAAKSLDMFENIDANISISGIITVIMIVRAISLWLVASAVHYISYKAKNNVFSLTVSGVIFILPAALYFGGVETMKFVSPLKCVSVTELIGFCENGYGEAILSYGIFMLIAAALLIKFITEHNGWEIRIWTKINQRMKLKN